MKRFLNWLKSYVDGLTALAAMMCAILLIGLFISTILFSKNNEKNKFYSDETETVEEICVMTPSADTLFYTSSPGYHVITHNDIVKIVNECSDTIYFFKNSIVSVKTEKKQ